MDLDLEYEKELIVVCKNCHEEAQAYKNAKKFIIILVTLCYLIAFGLFAVWFTLSMVFGFGYFNVGAQVAIFLCFTVFTLFGTLQLSGWILIMKAIKYYESDQKEKAIKYYKAYCTIAFKRKKDYSDKNSNNKNDDDTIIVK